MATITKRKGGWAVQVRRKGYSPQYKTLPSRAEAQAWARFQEGRLDAGHAAPNIKHLKVTTLRAILERYKDEISPTKRSCESEKLRLAKMMRSDLADLALADLTTSAIAGYRDARLLSAKAGTVRRELSLIHHALEIAQREWSITLSSNPAKNVSLPVLRNSRLRRLHSGEIERLTDALCKTRNRLIGPVMHFAIETGLRRGEILNLQWSELNLPHRTAFIRQTKTDVPRTIPLSPKAIQILEGLTKNDKRPFPLTPIALRLAWDRLRSRAGMPDLHFHDLRHEALSRFGELGLSALELALISGHRDIRMLARYTHLYPADLAAKLARLAVN